MITAVFKELFDSINSFRQQVIAWFEAGHDRWFIEDRLREIKGDPANNETFENWSNVATHASAEYCIHTLRAGVPMEQHRSYNTLNRLTKYGYGASRLRLPEVGVSRKEMKQFREAAKREYPFIALKNLREKGPSREVLNTFLNALRDANMTLEEVGSSPEETKAYEVKVSAKKARPLVERLRKPPTRYGYDGRYDESGKRRPDDALLPRSIYRFVETRGLTLEDIGTSKEEVEAYRKEYARIDAIALIQYLLRGVGDSSLLKRRIRQYQFTAKDLGVRQDVLDILLR